MLLPEVELHRNELPVPRAGSAWRNIAMPSLNGYATGGSCRECTTTPAELRQLCPSRPETVQLASYAESARARMTQAGTSGSESTPTPLRPHSDPVPENDAYEHPKTVPDHSASGSRRRGSRLPRRAARHRRRDAAADDAGSAAHLWYVARVGAARRRLYVRRSRETRAGDDDCRRARDGGGELAAIDGAAARAEDRAEEDRARARARARDPLESGLDGRQPGSAE